MSATNPAEPAAASTPGSASGAAARGADRRPATSGDTKKEMPKGTSTGRLFKTAIILSSLVFAVPITASRIAEAILDQTNPDNIKELENGLAYLGPILGWSFGALGVLFVVLIAVYAAIYRRERTLDSLKLPLLIVALQIVLGVVALIFNALTK